MTTQKHRVLTASLLALASLAWAGSAWAQSGSIAAGRSARPYVILLMDSSGSMEWEPGTKALPACDPPPAVSGKSRWITAAEVLTGTFEDYYCEIDARDPGDSPFEYQAGYYIDHVIPRFSKQADDGLLDLYVERINFGLMTLDSNASPSSTVFGAFSFPEDTDPAAPRHGAFALPSGEAVQAVEWTNVADTCSYRWNVGVRRADSNWPGKGEHIDGAMIPIYTDPPGNASGWHKKLNKSIQETILQEIRPYWNSPIGAALEDVQYYYDPSTGHPHARPKTGNPEGDCYWECRNRHVILVTDGVPSGEGMPSCDRSFPVGSKGACPYRTAEDAAYQLYLDDVRVHVIGFSIVTEEIDYDENGVGPAVRSGEQVVRDIGLAGHGFDTSNCPWNLAKTVRQCAMFADDTVELRDALTDIFDEIAEDANTMTRTATVNTFVQPANVMGQYQFFSSMNVATGGPWEGNIERREWLCVDTGGGVWDVQPSTTVYDYGDEGLDKLSITKGQHHVRRLYTVPPDVDILPESGGAKRTFVPLDDSLSPEHFGLDPADTTRMEEILDWMHGAEGSDRCLDADDCRRLGAIYHSSPAIVGPPSLELPLKSYNVGPHRSNEEDYDNPASDLVGFRQLYGRRPQILYTASTEGILHAFEVQREGGGDARELWGFVPPVLLDNLDYQTLGESFLLDGHIAVQDTRYWKDDANTDIEEWGTVLVMGLRQGGGDRSYFALDVTAPIVDESPPTPAAEGTGTMRRPADPGDLSNPGSGSYGEPRLLWQITPESSTGSAFAYGEHPDTYEGLGLAYGRPAFGTVILDSSPPQHSGSRGEVAVVFIPAGLRPEIDTDDDGFVDDVEEDAVGCGLFVVRAEDGQLVRWLVPSSSSTGGNIDCEVDGDGADCKFTAGWDCQFVGTPLALGALPGDATTRVFAGDANGRLWRADLRSSNPANWSLELFFDFENDRPIYEAPAAAQDERGLVTLIVGTGDPDQLETTPLNRMVSITETFGFNASGTLNPDTCSADWGDATGSISGDAFHIRPGYCTSTDEGVFPWVNWSLELGPAETLPRAGSFTEPLVVGERMVGWPVIFNDVAYFTTFVPHDDPDNCCVAGRGRVWGVHYIGDDPSATDDVFRPPTTLEPTPGVELVLMGENEVAFGAAIVRRPSCFEYRADDFNFTDGDGTRSQAGLGESSEPEYSLVLHNNLPSTTPPTGENPETGFREIQLEAPRVQCRPDSWAAVFGL